MISLIELAIVFIILAIFSIVAYKKNLLDIDGILISNAVGVAAITWGPNPLFDFFVVVIFFLTSELINVLMRKKHGQRGISNVLGNSIPALLMLFLIIVFPKESLILELAFFGAITAAFSDTLSSEIGYFSKSKPILITTFKKVRKGTDGGITFLGEAAALLASTVMAVLIFIIFNNILFSLFLIAAGLVGTNIDSIFGAIFERKKILNNTSVNLIGSFSGAITVIVLAVIFL